jgi:UDP-galactopyranose mutase
MATQTSPGINANNHHFGEGNKALPLMIVFCHLRWDFVYQRPQQLLSRMAEHYRILVVEEPFFHEGDSFLKSYSPCANVTIVQPHTNVQATALPTSRSPRSAR